MNYNQSKKKKRPQSSRIKGNDIYKEQIIIPNHINQGKEYFPTKDFTSANISSSNFPNIEKNNRSKSIFNESKEYKEDTLNEEYSIIQKIWEDLGVTYNYQIQFDNYIKSVSDSKLKNIFINEKISLKRFGDALLKLSKEISSRENNIHSLKRYVFSLLNNSNYFEDEENEKIKKNRENIILNMIGLIKSLRINSVNVITHFLKVREIVTYYNLVGKIDMNLISKEYNYEQNYLAKMRDDMSFLGESPKLAKYFDMNNYEIDAFLTNFSPSKAKNQAYSKLNNNKVKIPVSEDLKKAINQCRYILLQETFFENINKKIYNQEQMININDYQNDNEFDKTLNNSKINNISGIIKNTSKFQFFKDEDEIQKKYQNNFDNNNENIEEKEVKKLMENDKSGMNRSLEFLRKNMGKDYNILFLKNQNILKNRKIDFNNDFNNISTFRKSNISKQIKIEREERREKQKMKFKLMNIVNAKEISIREENEELNRQLNEICAENQNLLEEINNLKKYVLKMKKSQEEEYKEREKIGLRKNKELKKKELESELKYKELDKKKDILIQEKNNLNQKIKETNELMEKKNEENKQRIKEMNSLMEKKNEENERKINEIQLLMKNQKDDYEQKIEEKNNDINNLNSQREEIINEKNEIIKQKEQVIEEKNKLIEEKNNLENIINEMKQEIFGYQNEMEKYKKLQIDYQNLENKEKESEKQIQKLNEEIQKLNQEKINIENEANLKIEEFSSKLNELQQNGIDLNNIISSKENEKQNIEKEKEDLILEKNNLEQKLSESNAKIDKLNNKIKELNTNIKDLESTIKELNEELNELKGRSPDDTSVIIGNYKYDFYKENLFNFITKISEHLSPQKIPDFLKESFNLEKINIFDESTYIKGVYPKIVYSSSKTTKLYTGMCSIYYENYGQIGEPLILRIEALCVIENDWEEQIENMINFIKDKVIFDEIKYVISYIPSPEHKNKLIINQKIKDFFKKKLKFSWKNISNYADGSRTQDIRLTKVGNYFNQDIDNYNNNNKKIFGFNTLSILSLFDKDDRVFKEGEIDDLKNKYSNIGLSKYINLLPIFFLLANNQAYKMIFTNKNDANVYGIPNEDEMKDKNTIVSINPKNQVRQISEMEFNINDILALKNKINSSKSLKSFDIDDLLCEEIKKKLQDKISNFSFNYFTMNLNLSTTTNYCIPYENYFYNRISSKDIDILKDPKTKNLFYLIPTKTESTFILLCQVGRSLQKELLDGNKNIYDTFMDYHPKLTSQLIKFSSIGLTSTQIKDYEKTIYIPSFKIDTHLYSYSSKDINKKGKIIDEKEGTDIFVGAVEEFFTMSFEEDKDIKNAFSIIPVEDNKLNMVIREPFLFGVFNINIISSTPLQLFYVTKDHWIKSNSNTEATN